MEVGCEILRMVNHTNGATPESQEIATTAWKGHQTTRHGIANRLVKSRFGLGGGVGSASGGNV